MRTSLLALPALAALAAMALASALASSATFDEGVHLSAGYTYWATGDFRLSPVHPPLAKLIVAAPLLLIGVNVDFGDESWRRPEAWTFAHRFLYRWNDAERLLLRARLATVVLACLLAWAVFAWSRVHWGPRAAALSLVLCTLSPDVLGHGALATNDIAVSLFAFLAVVAFERLADVVTWTRLLAVGLAVGAAIATKFSGLILAPILLSLGIVVACGPWPLAMDLRGWPGGRRTLASRPKRLIAVVLLLVVVLLVSVLVVWAAYGFRYDATREPGVHLTWPPQNEGDGIARLAVAFLRNHRLLPEAYCFGLLDTFRRSAGRPAFLLGHLSDRGWWYYFPVAFLLKEPLAFLLLLLLAVGAGWRAAAPGRVEWFVWLPVLLYGAVCLATPVNIGIRFLLPAYPFLFVASGRCARLVSSKLGAVLLGLVLAWHAGSTARVLPYPIAYFNELAGGPGGGYRYLSDSNLDWGQGLKALRAYVEENRIPRFKLSYFGTADPGYYGLSCDLLPGSMRPAPERPTLYVRPADIVAVSATNLQGIYLPEAVRPLMKRLRSLEPTGMAGYSILIYRSDFSWLLPAEEAERLGWLDDAVASYSEATRADPVFAEGYGELGVAYNRLGRHRKAVAAFEEAVRLEPDFFERRPSHRKAWEASLAVARSSGRT